MGLRTRFVCCLLALLVGQGLAAGQSLEVPVSVERAGGGPAQWQLRSKHFVWGMPQPTDHRHSIRYPGEIESRPGLSVLVREGFVVGHYDRLKIPAWVAQRWSLEDLDRLRDGSYGRNFGPDPELPLYAQALDDYEYSRSSMERGHMARHEDNEAWGEDNSNAGCLMSNIVPQHKDMNGEAWNDLEELHQEVVGDETLGIDTVWVISGPVFEDQDGDGVEDPIEVVGNGIAVPHGTYKVVGWFDGDGLFQARGYVVRQEDRIRHKPEHYLTSIDSIEADTGLDFFPELPEDREALIEGSLPSDTWGPHSADGGATADNSSGSEVVIASLLPNPIGDESLNEAVTLRNVGSSAISLVGWKLRDAADRTWSLSGVLQAGDERTFSRDGQPMALNNSGDVVTLLDRSGRVIDQISYSWSREGVVISASDLR